MWMVIGLLSFVASGIFNILGIVAAIKKNGHAKKRFLIAGAFFVILVIALAADPTPAIDDSAEASTPNSVNSENDSAEIEDSNEAKREPVLPIDALREAVHQAFGEENSYDKKDSIVDIDISEESGSAFIQVYGQENFTTNMMRSGMQINVVNIMKKLEGNDAIKAYQFSIVMPLVDKYGNESVNPVMNVTIGTETLGKINLKNFDYRNLPDVADSYWEHPAIQ